MINQEKIKVLVLSHLFPNRLDPSKNIFIKEQVRFLNKECNIKVIAPVPYFPPISFFKNWYKNRLIERYEIFDGIDIYHPRYLTFPKAWLFPVVGFNYYIGVRKTVKMLLRKSSIDVLHAHFAFPDGYAASLLASEVNKKLIITIHGTDIFLYFNSSILKQLIVQTFIKCDKIIAVSTSLKKHLIEATGIDGNKIEIIPNGVDISRFAPMSSREDIEKRLGLPNNMRRIIYVGWLIKSKGVEELLLAFEKIADRRKDIEICLIGGYTGSAWEKEYNQIVKKISGSQFSNRIRIVGKVANEELPFWLNASDFLVLPSRMEGFGLVLVEALACGLPVISTYCGGPEDIVNKDNGILVNPGDVEGLANAIETMLSRLNEYDRVKIRAATVQKYDYCYISKLICEVYKRELCEYGRR